MCSYHANAMTYLLVSVIRMQLHNCTFCAVNIIAYCLIGIIADTAYVDTIERGLFFSLRIVQPLQILPGAYVDRTEIKFGYMWDYLLLYCSPNWTLLFICAVFFEM